ncbi:growth hormone secretagogue receptor type 1-like [Gigantopelta aegis]|uniref:growth hormone secretagogue receptor type 1-like n=1 Tax=Gigantopelta aegis TaxID=1735272 RepID=UPI001B8884C4|nr:growth hormone secretagogue receptor type 1-like [Gigantopelta aegis]
MCNVNNSSSCNSELPLENLDTANMFITVLNVIFVFVIIFGNALTVTAIASFRQLQYPSNMMIAALSLADILMGVAYTPLKLMRAHAPVFLERREICLTFMFTSHLCSLNAIMFLSLLSIERFYAVQFPFHYHAHVTVKTSIICNVVASVVLPMFIIPMVCGTDLWDSSVCYAPTLYPQVYTNILTSLSFAMMFIGFLCFLRVAAVELRFRRRRVRVVHEPTSTAAPDPETEITRDNNTTVNLQSEAANEIEIKGRNSAKTKVVLIAYAVSMCLWTPHIVVYIWDSNTKQHQNPYVFRVVSLLDLSSSAINFFLYGWKNRKFRHAYFRLLGLKK